MPGKTRLQQVAGRVNLSATTSRAALRRDFLYISATAMAATGGAFAAWPFIDVMNPSADVLAIAKIEVDLLAAALHTDMLRLFPTISFRR